MPKNISLRQAVTIAIEFIGDVYKDAVLRDIRLEEVEFEETGSLQGDWLVTVSFERVSTQGAVAHALGEEAERDFKTVVVSAANGEVLAMRIREPAH